MSGAQHHVLNFGRIDTGPLHGVRQGMARIGDRMGRVQAAAKRLRKARAGGGYDDGVAHVSLSDSGLNDSSV